MVILINKIRFKDNINIIKIINNRIIKMNKNKEC